MIAAMSYREWIKLASLSIAISIVTTGAAGFAFWWLTK
jgi:hypothetical protein